MADCVASDAPMVLSGRAYIYRVEGDHLERCTVVCVPRQGGWRVGQIQGPENSSVNAATTRKIREHVEGHMPKPRRITVLQQEIEDFENDLPF